MNFAARAKTVIGKFIHLGKMLAQKVLPEPIKRIIRRVLNLGERKIIRQHKQLLAEILRGLETDQAKKMIIFPPSLDWNVQLFQRPQQLALALARHGVTVFYLQPKPDRKQAPFNQISDGLYLCNVNVRVFEDLLEPVIYLLTWNSSYASIFKRPRILYDFVDDIDVFYGDQQQIQKGHEYLLKNAAIVLATAKRLVTEAVKIRTDVIYSPNGVDYTHFNNLEKGTVESVPDDLVPIIAAGKPIVGYYGALARWFDYSLLKTVASLRRQYSFVLIGPDYDGTLLPQRLSDHPNIHWLGVKAYQELPRYLQHFDVATIPFIVNEITHATSPLKLFEYMAGGKPVVITPMQESKSYTGVLVGETAEEFAEQVDQALQLRNDPTYVESLRQVARENTWDSRAGEIIRKIDKLIGSDQGSGQR